MPSLVQPVQRVLPPELHHSPRSRRIGAWSHLRSRSCAGCRGAQLQTLAMISHSPGLAGLLAMTAHAPVLAGLRGWAAGLQVTGRPMTGSRGRRAGGRGRWRRAPSRQARATPPCRAAGEAPRSRSNSGPPQQEAHWLGRHLDSGRNSRAKSPRSAQTAGPLHRRCCLSALFRIQTGCTRLCSASLWGAHRVHILELKKRLGSWNSRLFKSAAQGRRGRSSAARG